MANQQPTPSAIRILITAGPTHEPIDAVRFIGNRSSGRLGIALAEESAHRGYSTTLLLGPTASQPSHPGVDVHRFGTCEDLRTLLKRYAREFDVVIMAAAVADYRPVASTSGPGVKFRRTEGTMDLKLESTPDLIAELAAGRRPGQYFVAFALDPRDEVVSSALAKLERKRVDMVVGNPLETMDSGTIEAVVVEADGVQTRTDGAMTKIEFAPWLLDLIESRRGVR